MSSATFTTGQAGSFGVTTTGWPLPSLTESGALPAGVTFHDNGNGTGTLGGTPAAGAGGVYTFTVTATNGVGTDAVQTFTLTIDQPAALTSNPFTTFVVGAAGSFTATSTGYPLPSLADTGPWPTGLAFHDNGDGTGTLAGTAASGTGGVYDSTLTAHNGVGTDATQSFALTINEAPSFTNASSATFSTSTSGTFDFASLGWPLASYTENGALPTGVSFHDNGDGIATLSGTPDANVGGVYTVTVTAHNGVGVDATQTFTLTIDQPAAITSASSATFVIGSHGSFTVDTVGFPAPALSTTGALPSGVRFSDNGDGMATLSGTPTAGTSGVYNFSITAHNAVGTDLSRPSPSQSMN